jgi:hypothetical protein
VQLLNKKMIINIVEISFFKFELNILVIMIY